MKINILNLKGENIGEHILKKEIFDVELNKVLLKEIFEWQRNKSRSCTYGTLGRGELAYSTRKLRRQKGTGMARIGAKGAPHHKKGGVAHGPDGRNYIYSMPKKKIQKALFMSLSQVFRDGNLLIVEDLNFTNIKTKSFIESINKMKINNSCLFIDSKKPENFFKSMRNVIGYDFLPVIGINPMSIMKKHCIAITKEALEQLEVKYVK